MDRHKVPMYGMFTAAGDVAVNHLIKRLENAAKSQENGLINGPERFKQLLQRGVADIERDFPEVRDTAVREQIAWEVERILAPIIRGYGEIDEFYF